MNIKYNVILCGFMCAGKTTIGKQLSINTGLKFIDTDGYIEKKCGLTINEIFDRYKEPYFRIIEKSCINELAVNSGCIISTGGGVILDNDNILSLKSNGKIFLLDLPFDTIIARIVKSKTRPLIKNHDINSIKNLYDIRKEKYLSAADVVIDADHDIDIVCNSIISKIINNNFTN